MTIFKATAAMLLLGGVFSATPAAQNAPATPAVTITLVRWPFT